jgi:DNA-binding MarR family transcriptional regulator
MKKTKLQQILNVDLKNQLVSLRNQGKSIREISEITNLSISMLNQISSLFIKKGIWSPNPTWKKRMNTLNSVKHSMFLASVKNKEYCPLHLEPVMSLFNEIETPITRKKLGSLAETKNIPVSTLTQHLKQLVQLGFILKKGHGLYTKNNVEPVESTKIVKRVYAKREPEIANTITINFKGVNIQVEKTSNIIITQNVILVK